jgi:hypothetical protein
MRGTQHLPDRPLREDLIWTNAPANVPIPTAYERAQVQAYLRALGDFQSARLGGRSNAMAAASRRLDEIEGLARNPTSAEGAFLDRHLDAVRAERQRLQGQLTGSPPSGVPVAGFPRGWEIEIEQVFGTRIDDLPRLSNGRVAVPISGRLPPMRHRTLADLNSIMRGNPRPATQGTRVTWVLDDGSTVSLDIPGRGARLRSAGGRVFEISRRPHLSREFTSEFVVDNGRRVSLHVSDEGVIVPAVSSPAHIPVALTPAELRGLLRSLGREDEFAELVNLLP